MAAKLLVVWASAKVSVDGSVFGDVNIENGVGFPAWESMAHPPRKEKMLVINNQNRKPNFNGFIMSFFVIFN
jgi:hypothetical protein